ncbi:DUF1810 domain-containing protein [Lutimaribacter marinistellae]|uniref:DUF1810 domain-containing protein n=1 Tax=Lutimaribacter marinistellae TaxID=1820329 RepID=A0ABV7TE51_9RHOB
MDPELFLSAQDRVWPVVLSELEQGRKTSHWMWFVFPQLDALGRSATAKRFGLRGLDDAASYLAHPVLRERLVEVSQLMLRHQGLSAQDILGKVDAMKLRSSMTLFAAVPGSPRIFAHVLDRFFDGAGCPVTLQEIA